MPYIDELKQSNFLQQSDCGERGILVTIKKCVQMNVAKEGAPAEMKWCLEFEETEKPLVLNSTNGQIIGAITGQQHTDHWVGAKIVLYRDPNVTYGGKLVGGIRARAPRNQAAAPKPQPVQAASPTALPVLKANPTYEPPSNEEEPPF